MLTEARPYRQPHASGSSAPRSLSSGPPTGAFGAALAGALAAALIWSALGAAVPRVPGLLRAAAYEARRAAEQRAALARFAGYGTLADAGVVVHHAPGARGDAPRVLAYARDALDWLTSPSGLALPAPRAPLRVFVHPAGAALDEVLGWADAAGAAGLYRAGTVHVRAGDPGLRGVLAHEVAHFVLDHAARGNYPRWLSEGLAQLAEVRAGGDLWMASPPPEAPGPLSLTERNLARRSSLAAAYWESFLAVSYLEAAYGRDGVAAVVTLLGAGEPPARAVAAVTGMSPREIDTAVRAWAAGSDHVRP